MKYEYFMIGFEKIKGRISLISCALKCPAEVLLTDTLSALQILFSARICNKLPSGNRRPSSLLEKLSNPLSNSLTSTSFLPLDKQIVSNSVYQNTIVNSDCRSFLRGSYFHFYLSNSFMQSRCSKISSLIPLSDDICRDLNHLLMELLDFYFLGGSFTSS